MSVAKAPAHEWNFYHTARLKLWIPGVKTCQKPVLPQKNISLKASARRGKNHSFSFMMLFMFMHLRVFHFMFFRDHLFAFISTQFPKLFMHVLYRRILLFHRIWFGVCKTSWESWQIIVGVFLRRLAGILRAQPSMWDFSSTPLSIQNKRLCQCQHYRVEQIVVITVQVLSGNRKPILQDFSHTLSRHSILLHLPSCTK